MASAKCQILLSAMKGMNVKETEYRSPVSSIFYYLEIERNFELVINILRALQFSVVSPNYILRMQWKLQSV